jgi:aspartate/methionine/tyrosine aminotransferase
MIFGNDGGLRPIYSLREDQVTNVNTQSVYMHFAKTRPKVKYDLALSGILNLPFPELEAKLEDLDLNGDNAYGYRPLVDALAAHCQVAPESVVTISGGTSMANHLAMAAAIEHGDEVLIEEPTYEPILALAEYFGAQLKRFPRSFENGYRIDVQDLAKRVNSRTRLIVITNLHNPSSVQVEEATLRQIGELARSVRARVLVDEVYLEAMFEAAPPSSVHLGPEFIATTSLTKGYGLSGLRCGWIMAEPDLAQRIRLLRDIFDGIGPQPSERLSVVALNKLPKIIARAKRVLETNRAVLNEFLDSREELDVVRTESGTTSFPCLLKGRVEDLYNSLHTKYETAVVPGRFFESPQNFRLGMCAEPELFSEGVKRLGAALDEIVT